VKAGIRAIFLDTVHTLECQLLSKRQVPVLCRKRTVTGIASVV